jgi:hypothetical protein
MCHRLEMTEQCPLLKQNPGHDAVIARVMARTFRDGRKRMRVDADHPPPTHDPVHARHRTVQVARSVVEAMAGAAGDHVAQVFRWLRLSEQNFRVDKWNLCRG